MFGVGSGKRSNRQDARSGQWFQSLSLAICNPHCKMLRFYQSLFPECSCSLWMADQDGQNLVRWSYIDWRASVGKALSDLANEGYITFHVILECKYLSLGNWLRGFKLQWPSSQCTKLNIKINMQRFSTWPDPYTIVSALFWSIVFCIFVPCESYQAAKYIPYRFVSVKFIRIPYWILNSFSSTYWHLGQSLGTQMRVPNNQAHGRCWSRSVSEYRS